MEPGNYYHIYNRGNNKENLFKEDKNYQYFLKQYGKYLGPFLETYCYCLMPNHFHLFVRIKPDVTSMEVIKAFKNFFISYAKSINESYNRTGSLFQSNFKRKEIDNDGYFSTIIAYLHLNPVRAGLVNRPEEWNYSSYSTILSSKLTKIERNEVIEWFGDKNSFELFHKSFLVDEKVKPMIY